VEGLDEGETAAIALAISLDADLLLMDDREGVMVARSKGLRVIGTLGVLDLAAQRGLVNFAQTRSRAPSPRRTGLGHALHQPRLIFAKELAFAP
jgi:hypothetical protein